MKQYPSPPAPRPVLLLLLALCAGQVLLWGLGLGLNYRALEPDSAEQLVWGFSLQGGYWKHPPLPSWIMHALMQAFGASMVLPFLAAQAAIALALALTWRLGCEFMSPQRSLVALALTSLVTYHNLSGDSFNHSTALLPFQAAAVLLFYRATRSGQLRTWAGFGLCAGLAMLVKYVAAFPLAGLMLYLLADRTMRTRRVAQGLAVAAGVALLVVGPHLAWLHANDMLPLRYARSTAIGLPGFGSALWATADFLFTQVQRLAPLVLGAWLVLRRPASAPLAEPAPRPLARGDRLFILFAGLTPLALVTVYGMASCTQILSRWGSNAFLMAGWLLMAHWPRPLTTVQLRRALTVTVVGHVLLCAIVAVSKTQVSEALAIRGRANFPGLELAQRARQTWGEHSAAPLKLLVASTWLGGNIAAQAGRPLAVLIDGDTTKAPWVSEDTVRRCGALVLQEQPERPGADAAVPAGLQEHMARAAITGVWELPWAGAQAPAGGGARSVVRWGIVAPDPGETCPL